MHGQRMARRCQLFLQCVRAGTRRVSCENAEPFARFVRDDLAVRLMKVSVSRVLAFLSVLAEAESAAAVKVLTAITRSPAVAAHHLS